MNRDHSGGKRILQFVAMIVAVSFVSWAVMAQLRVKKLEDEIAAKKMRFAIIQLQRSLQIPSEVLYFDPKIGTELAELRMKSYTNYGVTRFLPYHNLVNTSGGSYHGNSREFPVVSDRDSLLMDLQNSSPENYWLNHLNGPCLNLAGQINDNWGLGAYFKQHPEVFDWHIRPLIVRLLDAYHPWLTYYGVEVLLAMGDRSEQLMEIVSIMLRLDSTDDQAKRMVAQYGLNLNTDESVIIHEESKTVRNPEWKRVHELAMELKAKYPVVDYTIIADLR
jgi:hypothetical protein